jgi:transketolase C-terminal domain/subunit
VTDAGLRIRLQRVGLPDAFCESGSSPYLVERYGLSAAAIAAAAEKALSSPLTTP